MTVKRYGVLCYLPRSRKKDMVLVTSRRRGNWVFPKGRRVQGKSVTASALQEAYEEAGLKGRIDRSVEIRVTIRRRGKKIILILYPMRVKKILKKWPESNVRQRVIVPLVKAEKLLACPGMKRGLKLWSKG